MPILAREVIDQARDYHASFDPRRHPDKVMLRALSRYQRRLAEKVTQLTEEALAEVVTFTKEDVDAAAVAGISGPGIALPQHILLLAAYTTWSAGSGNIPVDLVAYSNQGHEAVRRFPSAYLIRQALYPTNKAEAAGYLIKGSATVIHGWEELDGLSMLMVPVPPTLTTLSDPISLPDVAEDALVTNLALWTAQRGDILSKLPTLNTDADNAEKTAIASLGTQDTSSTWMMVRG